jgi:hypothetical protein
MSRPADDESDGGVDTSHLDDESDEEVDTSHLDDVDDGCGCTEIWEHMSGERDDPET